MRITVRTPVPLVSVRVHAFDQQIDAALVVPDTWGMLLGIDLDVLSGLYPVVVEAVTGSGLVVKESESVQIEPKEFPTRTLTVDPKFVTPPARVQARIEREAAMLRALFAQETPAASWPAPFVVPIDGVMVSGFGVRSVYNGEPRSPHGGADFASPTGTPVRAPSNGRVVLTGSLYYTGRTLVIDHGHGLYSLFAHLSRIRVAKDRRVRRGEVVGNVGATGRVTGPHLHWTVRLHGARVDPLSLVHVTAADPDRTAP